MLKQTWTFPVTMHHDNYSSHRKENMPCLYYSFCDLGTPLPFLEWATGENLYCWDLRWAVRIDGVSFIQQSLSSNHFALKEPPFQWRDSQQTDRKVTGKCSGGSKASLALWSERFPSGVAPGLSFRGWGTSRKRSHNSIARSGSNICKERH